MDSETLTHHISMLGKKDFNIACQLVLENIFKVKAINIDGTGDGGTDFIAIEEEGKKSISTYQITTQHSDIKRKAWKDAKKVIEILSSNKFYFFSTINIPESKARVIENDISDELNIHAICYGSMHIANFLIDFGLLNQFLDKAGYPLPKSYSTSPDYKEMALYAYTMFSKDAVSMRESIYDDTIVLLISNAGFIKDCDLPKFVIDFLQIGGDREEIIKKRIGALFGREWIVRVDNGLIKLNDKINNDLHARQRIYEKELQNLSASQIDIMRRDFGVDWSIDDSTNVSVFIADSFIYQQMKLMSSVKARVVINPIIDIEAKGIDRLKTYIRKKTHLKGDDLELAISKIADSASNHPLINKLARASIYIALEGADPMVSAKALGASRWSDYNILIEPTVAIPLICYKLYESMNINYMFKSSIISINKALEQSSSLFIPYYYINECAGHLLNARKYKNIQQIDFNELQYSYNAFIANYYYLKINGYRVPNDLMSYLKTFSPSILYESSDKRSWIRAIMTDIQGILTKSGINFIETPNYNHDNCKFFEEQYSFYLHENGIKKPSHLINNDVWSLQFTNDRQLHGEHWILITHDRSLIDMGKLDMYKSWVTNPNDFNDLIQNKKQLSENQYIALLHSLASYSERTLSAGARIIDRIVQYTSSEMKTWEFMEELRNFKNDLLGRVDRNTPDYFLLIDNETDEFLKRHGIKPDDQILSEEELVE